jgi:hypothetical protein
VSPQLSDAPRRQFEVSLPIGYADEEGTVHREVVLRKMTGREEAILADRKFQRNGGKLVTELLHSCVLSIGSLKANGRGPIAKLYSADRNYLLLKLRSITFGPELRATYTCSGCGESFEVLEDLDELPVRALGDGEDPANILVELEDGYVDRDGEVHTALTLRLPTGADEEAVAAQMRENASLGKNALLARCTKSLGEMAPHRVDALGTVIMRELTLTDRRRIDRAINDAAPGVDLARPLDCPSCGKSFTATLDMSLFFAAA